MIIFYPRVRYLQYLERIQCSVPLASVTVRVCVCVCVCVIPLIIFPIHKGRRLPCRLLINHILKLVTRKRLIRSMHKSALNESCMRTMGGGVMFHTVFQKISKRLNYPTNLKSIPFVTVTEHSTCSH